MRLLHLVLLTLLIVGSSGCNVLPEQEDETKGWSASQFYTQAKTALDEGDYETAIKYYELLEARHPYGRYAQQALLEVAYAYYKYEEPESAVAAANRFIRLHPRHPNVDYAYYLRGLTTFDTKQPFIESFFPQDPAKRDPRGARDAFDYFNQLVRKFPDSKYAEDARARMVYIRNSLARHQLHVAYWYMRRGAYLAAANRGQHVVENYPRTPAVADALAVMVDAYEEMGLDDLAADAQRVLALNHPNHPSLSNR